MSSKTHIKERLLSGIKTDISDDEKCQLVDYLLEDMGDWEGVDIDTVISDLNRHRPIQYIANVAHFYGYTFYVDEDVLIPRPETEELVYACIQASKSMKYGRLVDIGTGSGCIPIVFKLKMPEWEVTAIDISEKALAVAYKNSVRNGVDIDFVNCDVLKQSCLTDQYDIIVSNPPYIPNKEKALMHENVLNYEPHQALFVADDDPLIFYSRIAKLAESHLVKGGMILLEINEYLSTNVTQLFSHELFSDVEIIKDMQGKDRIVKAIRK